jgi:hypothetical protein
MDCIPENPTLRSFMLARVIITRIGAATINVAFWVHEFIFIEHVCNYGERF